MAGSATKVLRDAVFVALDADGTLSAAGIYQGQAPERSSPPYVVIQSTTEVPANHFSKVGRNSIVTIDVWSDKVRAAEAYTLEDLVDAAMDSGTLTVTGYTHIDTSFEDSFDVPDENYTRSVRRYLVMLQEA